jgi:hypothetical protein
VFDSVRDLMRTNRPPFFELTCVLVRFHHVAIRIVNANHNIVWKGEYSCRKRRKALSIGRGHISQIVGRSTFDSPPDRHFGKTSRFTSRHSFIAFRVQDRRKRDVSRYESKTLRRSKSKMGKAKGKGSASLDYKKEGRNYCSGKNKAFTVDESSMGSEEKSKRKEVNSTQHAFSQWLARAIR